MINVSNEFLETMNERTDFMESATITFTDGSVLELSGDDFTLSNNSLSDSAGTSDFPLGVALEKVIQIEIFNKDDYLWGYDFYGAQIRLRLSLTLSNSVETIDYGTYTVITPETYGTTVIIQAADDMYKADTPYETGLEFPATLRDIVQDSCHTTGIYLLDTTFKNDTFEVLEKPEDLTHRQVIGMAAMIACGYARMDFSNRLCITSYDISMFDSTDGLDGGYFDLGGAEACAALNIAAPGYSCCLYTNAKTFAVGTYNIEVELATESDTASYAAINFGFSSSTSFASSVGISVNAGEIGATFAKYSGQIELSSARSYFTFRNTTDSSLDAYNIYIRNLVVTNVETGETVLENTFTDGAKPSDWSTTVGSSRNSVTFNTADSYTTGDTGDGGSFNPWNTGDEVSGGSFEDMSTYHSLYNFTVNGLKLETDDVVITGIQTEDAEEMDTTYVYGEEGYVLDLENDLIAGKEKEAIALIGEALIGFRFRPFEGDHIAYPIAEYGDIALVVDSKDRAFQTILTDIDFVFRGLTTFKCSAESPIRNSASYYAGNDYVKAIKESRKVAESAIAEYDKSVQMLADLIANSFGVFKTEEVLEDGSVIYYLHDKPTLEESVTIWEMTADAFAVSTDGGKTWNAGMDSSGNVVANVLSVIGINFDWAHGGTLILGGYNNENGVLIVNNASGKQVGKWDKDGVEISEGTITTGNHEDYFSEERGLYLGDLGISVGEFFRFDSAGNMYTGAGKWTSDEFTVTVLDTSFDDLDYTLQMKPNNISYYNEENKFLSISPGGIASSGEVLYYTLITSGESEYLNYDSQKVVLNNGYDFNTRSMYYDEDILIGGDSRIRNGKSLIFMDYQGLQEPYLYCPSYANSSEIDVIGNLRVSGSLYTSMGTYSVLDVEGNASASGQLVKSVDEENYGVVNTYSYETASPLFGDVGSGVIGEDGQISICFSEDFIEAISDGDDYYVGITRTSPKEVDYVSKFDGFFIVYGESGATFDWTVSAHQRGYELTRMESTGEKESDVEFDDSIFDEDNAIEDILQEMIEQYEREVAL